MSDESIIDPAALERLHRLGGEVFVARMVELFFSHPAHLLAEARQALQEGNLEPIRRAGHSLKSGSANVGATAMREAALRLEQAVEDQSRERLAQLLTEVEDAYARARARIEELRKEKGS